MGAVLQRPADAVNEGTWLNRSICAARKQMYTAEKSRMKSVRRRRKLPCEKQKKGIMVLKRVEVLEKVLQKVNETDKMIKYSYSFLVEVGRRLCSIIQAGRKKKRRLLRIFYEK
jgi:hypothetical protein